MNAAPPQTEWICAKEVAAHFMVTDDSVYRWRDCGVIPQEMVRFCGRRRMLFSSAVLDHLEREFSRSR